jgi:hypothetical protein
MILRSEIRSPNLAVIVLGGPSPATNYRTLGGYL